MTADDCVEILRNYPFINHITLSGCCTAAAQLTNQEKIMWLEFNTKIAEYYDKEVTELTEEHYHQFIDALLKKPLQKDEFLYKYFKELMPFLGGVRLSEEEAEMRLTNSLMKQFMEAIQKADLGRDITLKAMPIVLNSNVTRNENTQGLIAGPSGFRSDSTRKPEYYYLKQIGRVDPKEWRKGQKIFLQKGLLGLFKSTSQTAICYANYPKNDLPEGPSIKAWSKLLAGQHDCFIICCRITKQGKKGPLQIGEEIKIFYGSNSHGGVRFTEFTNLNPDTKASILELLKNAPDGVLSANQGSKKIASNDAEWNNTLKTTVYSLPNPNEYRIEKSAAKSLTVHITPKK
jgi:hypothetical protein